jgi:hypothetical protein
VSTTAASLPRLLTAEEVAEALGVLVGSTESSEIRAVFGRPETALRICPVSVPRACPDLGPVLTFPRPATGQPVRLATV